MLPFPRLTQYGNVVVRNQYALNIDFRRQNVGDTSIIDYSPSTHVFTKLNTGQANIVQDSTLGTNVMYFNGGLFSTPMTSDLQLMNKNFELDVMYKCFGSGIQVIYGSGYYPDTPNRIPGIAHQIGQYSGQDQYLIDDGNTYQRNLIGSSNSAVWQRLVYTKTSSGVDIKIYRDSVLINSVHYANYPYGNGTSFGIGGYYKTPSQWIFYGWIQYLQVKIL